MSNYNNDHPVSDAISYTFVILILIAGSIALAIVMVFGLVAILQSLGVEF